MYFQNTHGLGGLCPSEQKEQNYVSAHTDAVKAFGLKVCFQRKEPNFLGHLLLFF